MCPKTENDYPKALDVSPSDLKNYSLQGRTHACQSLSTGTHVSAAPRVDHGPAGLTGLSGRACIVKAESVSTSAIFEPQVIMNKYRCRAEGHAVWRR